MNRARKITHLKNFVRNTTFATYGLTHYTREEASDMVDTLVTMGKLKSEEGAMLLERLSEKLGTAGLRLEKKIEDATTEMLNKLEQHCQSELAEVSVKVAQLEQRVSRFV